MKILATDCGSTTTKAILIEEREGGYRLAARGEAPTTVEAPVEDVTEGVLNAVREVEEQSGYTLIAGGRVATDLFLSTSSAGGGLQMMVAGVIGKMTAESAARAALGAGAIVMDTISSDDGRADHEKVERIRQLRPDMILLAGGTDGGTTAHVVALAELIAAARPRPRLGQAFDLPVIYAGNVEAAPEVQRVLAGKVSVRTAPNLRPVLERENLGPARDAIAELFLEHVMKQAPGYAKLVGWTGAPILPTPGAVGLLMQAIAAKDKKNVVGVDIGGATTDVFSVIDGRYSRTVSANLGMSYSVSNVLAEAGLAGIRRWLPFRIDEAALRDGIGGKMIRPTTIPETLADLQIEQAVAREALRLSFAQHRQFSVGLRGVQSQRTVADAFDHRGSATSLVDPMTIDLVVGSGGVLSHAPRRAQAALMLIDAFAVEGVTELAVDSIFMMPHLGVLSTVNPAAATEVFERDCLVRLGTCVAPVGAGKAGQPCLDVTVDGRTYTLHVGELVALPIERPTGAVLEPARGWNVGAGNGQHREVLLRGGVCGLILDGRGRPLEVSEGAPVADWLRALGAYTQ